jgi:hypothetical protein
LQTLKRGDKIWKNIGAFKTSLGTTLGTTETEEKGNDLLSDDRLRGYFKGTRFQVM